MIFDFLQDVLDLFVRMLGTGHLPAPIVGESHLCDFG